jgi:hypothetical protein
MEELTLLEKLAQLNFASWEGTAGSLGFLVVLLTGLIKKWKPVWTEARETKILVAGALGTLGVLGLKFGGVGFLGEGDWYPHVAGVWLATLAASGAIYGTFAKFLTAAAASLKDKAETQPAAKKKR